MRFSNRPHPLKTSRFWFLILACVGATTMWQLGMFPGQSDESEEFVDLEEIELLSEEEDSRARVEAAARDRAHEEPIQTAMADGPDWASTQAPSGQSEFASEPAGEASATDSGWWLADTPTEPSMLPAETATSALPAQQTDTGDSASEESRSEAVSPFGPANPEFVGVPGADVGSAAATTAQDSQFPEWDSATTPTESDVQTAAARLIQPASDSTSQPSPTVSASSAGGAVDFTMIDGLLAQGDDVGAHRELSTLYWQRPELRPLLMERLQATARRIYFQPTPHYMEAYVVQPADTLQGIAHRYEVSWQFLGKLNQVEPTRIRPGQELKVIRGPFSAVVDLSDHEITVHAHGYFVCSFPVGIGRDGSTPVGTFQVDDKLVDPTYYGPDGIIAHDDPTNPLGEHWISIGDSYGIHGTIDPDSIGRDESQGCVRLRNEDVAEVYDFLTVGSEVVIRE